MHVLLNADQAFEVVSIPLLPPFKYAERKLSFSHTPAAIFQVFAVNAFEEVAYTKLVFLDVA